MDSAERALQQMMDGVTPSRSLAGLLTAAEHKTAFVRGKVASLLYLLFCQKLRELRISFAAGGKELDGLKARISKLVHDQTPEARTASRNIVRFLVKEGIVSKWEWCQHIPADQLDKILLQALTPPIAMSTGNQDANSSAHESPSNRRSSNPVITKQRILAQGRSSLNSSASFLPPQPKQTLSVNTPILEDLGKVDAAEGFVSEGDVDGRAFNANNKKTINLYASNSSGSVKLPASNCLNSSGQFASKHNSLRRRDSNALVAKRAMDGPDLVGVPELTHTISTSSSSIERQDAIKSLTSLIISHWQVMLDAGKLGIYLDCLLERLEDGSVKVVHCTLTCLQRIQDDAPGALSPSPALQIVVTSALHVAASSSNRSAFFFSHHCTFSGLISDQVLSCCLPELLFIYQHLLFFLFLFFSYFLPSFLLFILSFFLFFLSFLF